MNFFGVAADGPRPVSRSRASLVHARAQGEEGWNREQSFVPFMGWGFFCFSGFSPEEIASGGRFLTRTMWEMQPFYELCTKRRRVRGVSEAAKLAFLSQACGGSYPPSDRSGERLDEKERFLWLKTFN